MYAVTQMICGPECPGCTGCTIATDPFDRDDNSDINDGAPVTWSGDTGSFQIIGLSLFTFSSDKQLKCGTQNTDGTGSAIVSTIATGYDDGDEAEIWLNGGDSDTCIVARLTFDSTTPTLELIQRVSDVDTVLDSVEMAGSAGPFDQIPLTLYYDAATRRATATAGNDPDDIVCDSADTVGNYAGLGVGTVSSAIEFQTWTFERLSDGENGCEERPECPGEPLCDKIDDESLDTWEAEVTVSGMVDGTCANCDTIFNNTFLVPWRQWVIGAGEKGGQWILDTGGGNAVCAGLFSWPTSKWGIIAAATCNSTTGLVTLIVTLFVSTPPSSHFSIRFRLIVTEAAFLSNSVFTLPYLDGGAGGYCNGSGIGSITLAFYEP